jgi:hypothetical protein
MDMKSSRSWGAAGHCAASLIDMSATADYDTFAERPTRMASTSSRRSAPARPARQVIAASINARWAGWGRTAPIAKHRVRLDGPVPAWMETSSTSHRTTAHWLSRSPVLSGTTARSALSSRRGATVGQTAPPRSSTSREYAPPASRVMIRHSRLYECRHRLSAAARRRAVVESAELAQPVWHRRLKRRRETRIPRILLSAHPLVHRKPFYPPLASQQQSIRSH